jgi:hypothetical protein
MLLLPQTPYKGLVAAATLAEDPVPWRKREHSDG